MPSLLFARDIIGSQPERTMVPVLPTKSIAKPIGTHASKANRIGKAIIPR